jgi:hypothetical protein
MIWLLITLNLLAASFQLSVIQKKCWRSVHGLNILHRIFWYECQYFDLNKVVIILTDSTHWTFYLLNLIYLIVVRSVISSRLGLENGRWC